MLIVSQDKDVINFDNVEAIGIGKNNQDKWSIYARLNSNYVYKIAEYDTEENARAALEELTDRIVLFEYFKCIPAEGKLDLLDELSKDSIKVNIVKMKRREEICLK